MLVSILHRVTGDGLAVVGLGVLLWWLGALASGRGGLRDVPGAMGSPGTACVVLVGLSAGRSSSTCASGMRHFVLDIGAGYELDTERAVVDR